MSRLAARCWSTVKIIDSTNISLIGKGVGLILSEMIPLHGRGSTVITDLRTILLSIYNRSLTLSELERLFHITRSVAETFLSHYRNRYRSLCEQSGISFTDLATDCILEIFRPDEKNIYPRLKHFLASLSTPPETIASADLFLAYKSLVIEVTKAHLARAYAEMDPQGARLSRNVKEAVDKKKASLRLIHTPRGYALHPVGSI